MEFLRQFSNKKKVEARGKQRKGGRRPKALKNEITAFSNDLKNLSRRTFDFHSFVFILRGNCGAITNLMQERHDKTDQEKTDDNQPALQEVLIKVNDKSKKRTM